MAINNDAAFRHRVINRCLRNNMRKWTKQMLLEVINEELAEKYGFCENRKRIEIKERQLNYDLNDMEAEYGAPIERYREGKLHFYRYSDITFSIENLPINDQEVQTLREAVNLLKHIKGFNISEDMDAVVKRLENKIKTSTYGNATAIAFENLPIATGTEYLSDLFDSILQKTTLAIQYKPFKATEALSTIIHPYFLKEYNNRWFLLGWNDNKDRLETMALDRINKINIARKEYRTNLDFNPENYFADMIGITRMPNSLPETILIKVHSERAPYFTTKPLHPSQKVVEKNLDGSLLISYFLLVNFELENLFLSFGPHLEVIEPLNLRDRIKLKIEQSLALYNGK